MRLGRPPAPHLPHWPPDSSGYARSFLRRALSRAAPSSAHCACGVPSRHKSETSVVSKTTCASWNSGNPSATTSRRRASTRSMGNKSKSLTITFVVTLAPASRHTRAAAFSKANPQRGVFEGRNPEMCTFGLSGCRVKPRRLFFFFEDEKEKSVTVPQENNPKPQPTTLTCRCSETTSAWVGVGPSHPPLGLTSIRD